MSVKTIQSGLSNSFSGEGVQESQIKVSKENHSKKSGKGKGVIYAGDLNMGQDEITLNRIKNQKKAMKTILEQYQKDNKADNNVTKIKEHKQELNAELKYAAEQYRSLKDLRQELKTSNGMTDESEEEVNLSILEKSIYGDEELTEEEQKKLASMGPLTEYQKTALQYDAMAKTWQNRIDNINNGISNDSRSIISIKLELLKTHPMVDAQKEAVKILEAAAKETIGRIVDDAKDKFDEEQEKKTEEAKEKQKKEQEEAERLQKLKEEQEKKEGARKEEGVTPELVVTDTTTIEVADVKQVRQDALSELMIEARKNMIEEDTKGISVDEYI